MDWTSLKSTCAVLPQPASLHHTLETNSLGAICLTNVYVTGFCIISCALAIYQLFICELSNSPQLIVNSHFTQFSATMQITLYKNKKH